MHNKFISLYLILITFTTSCTPFYRYKLEDAKKNARGLDLSSSNYIVPPDEIFDFPCLEDINLSDNPYMDWDATFDKLTQISNLDALILDNNFNNSLDLKKVIINLSELKNIKYLSLGGNNITILPNEISMLTSLESIELGYNPNININDTIEKLSKLNSLRHISMEKCGIDSLPIAITNIESLEVIHLFGNNLDSLPDLSNLDIRSIDIGENQFKSIPISIFKIKKRFNFYAQRNQISFIPNEIASIKFGTFSFSNNPLPPAEKKKIKKLVKAWYMFY